MSPKRPRQESKEGPRQRSLDLRGKPASPSSSGPTVVTRLSPARPTEVYDTYWRFAAERQRVFFRKLDGAPPPWTEDDILQRYKFTNAYRASDRVSQYLIRHVIYQGDQSPEEVFFRTLLFKLFNRISTWELLRAELGEITWAGYSYERYDRVLSTALSAGSKLYSAAYIMPPAKVFGHRRKHRNYLRLLEVMMKDEVPVRIPGSKRMQSAYEILRSYPSLGDFLAYQFVTDINYSQLTDFSELEFVVPGPGARDGIQKCFRDLGGLNEVDMIRLVTERQEQEFERLGLSFRTLWGRSLQLIDCQNLFCEVAKYARLRHPTVGGRSGRTHIKQTYRADPEPIRYWYPPKWGLNDSIGTYLTGAPPDA